MHGAPHWQWARKTARDAWGYREPDEELDMIERLAVYELAARHGLDASAARRLQRLAGLDAEPAGLAVWLPRGVALLAAGLTGLGLVLWVAANWDSLGRLGQFALLQGLVVTLCLGALTLPAARPPLGLLALLAVGGLLAYLGQTYQTGADPWQLFALWAGLCLPLCLAVRSDALWASWALVVTAAIALWIQTRVGPAWRVAPDDLLVHAQAWAAAAILGAWLSPAVGPLTGAGVWAWRTAVTLAVTLVTLAALSGLLSGAVAPHYWLGLLVLAAAAGVLALPRSFEVAALSAVVLGLNVLMVAGLGYWLLEDFRGDPIARLLVLGLGAAGLLAASVSIILRLARRHGHGGAA
jgi:uncharacterized membrane protein